MLSLLCHSWAYYSAAQASSLWFGFWSGCLVLQSTNFSLLYQAQQQKCSVQLHTWWATQRGLGSQALPRVCNHWAVLAPHWPPIPTHPEVLLQELCSLVRVEEHSSLHDLSDWYGSGHCGFVKNKWCKVCTWHFLILIFNESTSVALNCHSGKACVF